MAKSKSNTSASRGVRVKLVSSLNHPVTVDLIGDNDVIVPAKGKVEDILKSKIIKIPAGIRVMEK